MLSNFIRRNGKRKRTNKVIEPYSHQKALWTSDSSQISLPRILDINDTIQRSPAVELNLSDPSEEWFPQELLQRRSCTPRSPPPVRAQDTTESPSKLAQEISARPSPVPSVLSLSHSEKAPSVPSFRKKSIPAPIIIPDADRLTPKVQIGQPTTPVPPEPSQPIANDAPSNLPSPSVSDDLSSVSGTTLARALIASSFVLSSIERHGSRHRNGVVRQDSATLPRGSFFLSESRSSSPIPPVPPVPPMVNISPDLNYSTAAKSGESTASEYPTSDSYYTTSPEMASSFAASPIPHIQKVSPSIVLTSTDHPPLATPNTKAQRRAGSILTGVRVPKSGMFDVPQTASLPQNSQEKTQGESVLLGSDDHNLDEFDFVPPGPLPGGAFPESDSSTSYGSLPIALLPGRRDTNRGQWKRRVGGSKIVRDGSKDSCLSEDAFASRQANGLPSSATSEHDYGELFNYDLTVSPDSNVSSSSASAGLQTFPETPVVFSPIWSAEFAFVAKSDGQVRRRRLSSMKSATRGPAKLHLHMKSLKRQGGNNGGGVVTLRKSRTTVLPKPSPKGTDLDLPSSVPVDDDESIPEETNQSSTNKEESQDSVETVSADRPHPLARISSSSSCVPEEEALRVLARHSHSSLPSIIVFDPSFDLQTDSVSDTDQFLKSPTVVQLPDSTDISPSSSPALDSSTTAISLQSPLSMTSTAVGQSHSLKSLLSSPSTTFQGSSFLPSPSPPISPHPPSHSPAAGFSSVASVPHSPSPSFVPPPAYHTVVSERIADHHPGSVRVHSLSRTSYTDPGLVHSRQASNSSLAGSVRTRVRSRPPLPFGPRKPSIPGQGPGPILPGIRTRNGSISSDGSNDPSGGSGFSWSKLHAAASKPPPKFQAPPPKWRGLTLEAAQWTFTSAQLQEIVSKAIQQSSEGSSLRLLRPDILEGEITDKMNRLELQHMDVKAQYKALARKRWMLMGALAGHVEGVEMGDVTTAARTVEELAEVLSALDGLTEKMHDTALQMAQLTSLRDVHNTSALALAVRKINGLFIRQMAEKERVQDQVETLRTERDEAWKHAEDIAQDYDTLNDRVSESAFTSADPKADALSATSSKRSTRISAVRKSSARVSQAGLRSRSKHRPGRSSSNATRPASLALDDIPPVPRLLVYPSTGSPAASHRTGHSRGSGYSSPGMTSAALALADAQREVYEMLGLSVPPSQASSRRRTLSGPDILPLPSSPKSRPASEPLGHRAPRTRSHQGRSRATRSVIIDERPSRHVQHAR